MNPKRWRPELVALIAAAGITRFWNLFQPRATVFDEVYFKAFPAHYLDHRYFFDIHPPLGKLLLAGFAKLLGLTPTQMLQGTPVGMRLLPAFAGMLLVPLMWGILRRFGASRPLAGAGAFLVLCDNALLVESRFILMDSMLVLAGLAALYFYLIARKSSGRARWLWLALAATAAGMSVSIKWTGANALAVIALILLWDQHTRRTSWTRRAAELGIIIIIPVLIYLASFWAHFALLTHSGDGDAFMTPAFQATLIGNPYYNPRAHMSFWQKFIELNKEMYEASATLTATHPYGSKWYTWPLEIRPIYYWEGPVLASGAQGNIYLLGNPVVWWGIWVAIIGGLLYAWSYRHGLRPATKFALSIATVAYFINLLPFVGVTRVMFLYHYLFSFLYSIIAAVMLINDLVTNRNNRQFVMPRSRAVFVAALALVALGFIYFAPISYGTPLSPAGLQARMWLHSWR